MQTHTWPRDLRDLLLLYNQPLSWYFVTFAKLTPLHLQLSQSDHNRRLTFQKVPFISRALPSVMPWLPSPPLSAQADPALRGWPLCVIRLCRHRARQPGDSANQGSRTAGCEADLCVCLCTRVKKKEDAAVWMSDSSLLITGFEELTVSFSKA